MASWRKFVFDTRQLFYLQSLNILNEALVRDILELPELTSSQQSLYKVSFNHPVEFTPTLYSLVI
jgi:hypothetical protein